MKIVNIEVFVNFRPSSTSTETLECEYSKNVLEFFITDYRLVKNQVSVEKGKTYSIDPSATCTSGYMRGCKVWFGYKTDKTRLHKPIECMNCQL